MITIIKDLFIRSLLFLCFFLSLNNYSFIHCMMQFFENLQLILNTFTKKHKLYYYLNGKRIETNVVFHTSGLLPLFLFDKSSVLSYYIQQFNQTHYTYYHAHWGLQQKKQSLLGFEHFLLHNMNTTRSLKASENLYIQSLFELGTHILNDKTLACKGNKVYLDSLYLAMKTHYNSHPPRILMENEISWDVPNNSLDDLLEMLDKVEHFSEQSCAIVIDASEH